MNNWSVDRTITLQLLNDGLLSRQDLHNIPVWGSCFMQKSFYCLDVSDRDFWCGDTRQQKKWLDWNISVVGTSESDKVFIIITIFIIIIIFIFIFIFITIIVISSSSSSWWVQSGRLDGFWPNYFDYLLLPDWLDWTISIDFISSLKHIL